MSNTESIATERWRSVPGYEGFYEVSDHGRVRSLDREVINRWGPWLRRGQLMTTVKADRTDHRVVRLSMYGKARSRFVHRLVLEAFVGPCPEGMECCHGNGIADDNRVENLRWDTKSANILDTVQHGTHPQARKTHCAKGHEYSPENTTSNPRWPSGRICKTCYGAKGTGVGTGYHNASKTHCKRGHEFTPKNTYLRKGWRVCRACRAVYDAKRKSAVSA